MYRHLALCLALGLVACGGGTKDAASSDNAPPQIKNAIPVPEFAISKSPADVSRGQELFGEKGCTACHKVGGGKLVGPDLKGVTARRDETWIKRMILRPDVMVKEDDTAKKLLAEHMTPMPNQGVDPATELPKLLAYLKSVE
jgi:mono/diheme cytochrome c family protein